MALVYKDRVKQVCTAPTTTNPFDFTGAATSTGYQTFVAALADGETCVYAAEDADGDWEVGIGTWTEASDQLARTTVLASSNAGSAETFSGDTTVYITWDAAHSSGRMDTVSVTGTATLTSVALGNLHICSGTSADYTVTLPTAASCSGGVIHFAMASGLTKLVTLDANGTETIDGSLTRIMYANETATLFSDGTTWTKIAGKTLPIVAQMSRDAAQSIASSTVAKILFDTIVFNAAGCADATTNDRFDIKRSGKYLVSGSWFMGGVGGLVHSRIHVDGVEAKTAVLPSNDAGLPIISEVLDLTAGSYVELHVYQTSGASQNTYTASAVKPRMTVTEIQSW